MYEDSSTIAAVRYNSMEFLFMLISSEGKSRNTVELAAVTVKDTTQWLQNVSVQRPSSVAIIPTKRTA